MSSRVAVVTDSTAALPPALVASYGIGVVPLHVVLGRRTGAEGVDVKPDEVAEALRERRAQVTTSRPTPSELAAAYRDSGATEVVSVHLSGQLSGTVDAARLAARQVAAEGLRVAVVDTRTLAMGLGFAVLAAARAARSGCDLEAVEAAAVRSAAQSSLLFYVDTLEHLRRGGRIGAASALVGTALAVKPLLQVVDGSIAPLVKVRTRSRALARLEDLAVEAAGDAPVGVAVHHLDALPAAGTLAERLADRVADCRELHVVEVGAVIGAHTGPGSLGVVVSPQD